MRVGRQVSVPEWKGLSKTLKALQKGLKHH